MEDPLPHVDGVTHRFVEVNGLNLHVAEAGSGEPLLMLHGWPQHWYMWRNQIPALSQHYRLICPDMRGFGWSDAPAGGYEKEALVDDVIALLDAMRVPRVRLMGHDWGGWVGYLLCLRKPELVDRYLALNIPHPFQKFDSRGLDTWRFWYQWVISSPLGRWVVGQTDFVERLMKMAVDANPWTDEEIAIFAGRLKDPARANASVQLYRTFVVREFMPVALGRYRSKRLSTPTLELFGLHDIAISPRFMRGYEPYSDDLKVEFVDDCGHFIAEEKPDLVTERALELFAG
jgi:pimeloyl-ACP methyl ester carboxylesterase